MTIAIDGPVGAGKSTIAQGVADALGVLHLDTGAMYRAMGLKALRAGIDPKDAAAAEALCAETDISVEMGANGQKTLLDGEDVSSLIRTAEVSAAASGVSTVKAVRRRMVALQQACAKKASMVVDGRDIGTGVLPDASFKFYLTASPEVRAKRRYLEMQQKGEPGSYEEVLAAVIARDDQDMHREADPLRRADDAFLIDSSNLTLDETVQAMLDVIREAEK